MHPDYWVVVGQIRQLYKSWTFGKIDMATTKDVVGVEILHVVRLKFLLDWGVSLIEEAKLLVPLANQLSTAVLNLSHNVQCHPNKTRSRLLLLTYYHNLLFYLNKLEQGFPSFSLQFWHNISYSSSVAECDISHSICS